MKKWVQCAAVLILAGITAGCMGKSYIEELRPITVIDRESGSGTKYSFDAMTGLNEPLAGGERDRTVNSALVMNSTDQVLMRVSRDRDAIGYVSMGSVTSKVKILSVNGVRPPSDLTGAEVYPLTRQVYLIFRGNEKQEAVLDFMEFIKSRDGAGILIKEGFSPAWESKSAYRPRSVSGNISVGGSSSLRPVMQRMIASYEAYQPRVRVSLQDGDSLMGVHMVLSGTISIGLLSRPLTAEEEKEGARSWLMAKQAVAVVVNPQNPIENISEEELKSIYTGRMTTWPGTKENN